MAIKRERRIKQPANKPLVRINSRAKGASGEREFALFLQEHGYPARRGQQFHGGPDSPDVVVPGLDDFHLEVKRVEHGNPYDWLDQAVGDAKPGRTPVVAHRRNRRGWIAVLRFEDFLSLILCKGLPPCSTS